MLKWFWKWSDEFEGMFFRRSPNGWIFRSPISWTFGFGPWSHYLVSDEQKSQIAEFYGLTPDFRWSRWFRSYWRSITLMAILVTLPAPLLFVYEELWYDPQLGMLIPLVLY